LPSRIFVSVGDGVIISGVYKGFEDLLELGVIDKMPVIVAVQSEKSDNLVRNVESESFEMTPATTIADSISVDYPRNYFMAKSYLRKYKGEWLSVTDEEIIKAASSLARNTGIFAEPAAAAAMAGMLKYSKGVDTNRMNPMLVLSTGSGLKDTKTPMQSITLPQPIKPNIEALSDFIVKNI
jgi:threonine synthase